MADSDPYIELMRACKRLIVARESGIATSGHYHAVRHALRRCDEAETAREAP